MGAGKTLFRELGWVVQFFWVDGSGWGIFLGGWVGMDVTLLRGLEWVEWE